MVEGLRFQIESSIREIVFGLEDSLVSTLGTVTGIAAGTGSTYVVILSGVVLIFVESLSMSAGSFLSSKSAQEVMEKRIGQDRARLLQRRKKGDRSLHELLKQKKFSASEVRLVTDVLEKEHRQWMKEIERCEHSYAPSLTMSPVKSGVVMGVFYLVGGIFPLMPYFFLPVMDAILPSILITGVILFVLGWSKARIAKTHWMKSALEMTTVSLTAAMIGFVLGRLVSSIFGINLY
jgi:vacuolar iron transporter family protein